MNVVPRPEFGADDWSLKGPSRKTRIARFLRTVIEGRKWRCFWVTAAIFVAGIYALGAIYVVATLADAWNLPQHGPKVAWVLFLTILFSFLPGVGHLQVRATRGSHVRALKAALLLTFGVTYVAVLIGASVESIALVAMRAMGVIDNTERTHEIIKAEERPIYQALGYSLKSGDRFVEAFIRFQFGDVKLICPKKYPFPGEHAPSEDKSHSTPASNSAQPKAVTSKENHLDSTGCLTPTKDEIRVVDLPDRFTLQSTPPATVRPDRPKTHVTHKRRRAKC